MEVRLQEVREYLTPSARNPFREWLVSLKDIKARAIIRVRLNRLRLGNFGDCRLLGGGIHELRMDFGPGYRVYFGRLGPTIVLLLCGGDKGSQRRDVEQAKEFWEDYRRRSS